MDIFAYALVKEKESGAMFKWPRMKAVNFGSVVMKDAEWLFFPKVTPYGLTSQALRAIAEKIDKLERTGLSK